MLTPTQTRCLVFHMAFSSESARNNSYLRVEPCSDPSNLRTYRPVPLGSADFLGSRSQPSFTPGMPFPDRCYGIELWRSHLDFSFLKVQGLSSREVDPAPAVIVESPRPYLEPHSLIGVVVDIDDEDAPVVVAPRPWPNTIRP